MRFSPSIQLSVESIELDITLPKDLQTPMVLQVHLPEAAMQPFPRNEDIKKQGNFFKPGAKLKVTLT